MILTGITLLLLAAMAVNHAVHGFGCWGLQPGGQLSGLIYDCQILAAVAGVIWLLTKLGRGRATYDFTQLLAIAAFAIASIFTFWLYGWASQTSAHHQGAENLIAYLVTAATTYLIGKYRAPPVHAEPRRELEFDVLSDTGAKSNPYKSPRVNESTLRRVV